MKKNWRIAEKDSFLEQELSTSLGLSPLLVRILINRGITEPGQIRQFLEASLSNIFNSDNRAFYHPLTMLGMDRAIERIMRAILNKERIAIHGDYDVDGITSTSLLYSFFREIQVDVLFYIPHRIDEGYDLSEVSVRRLKDQGTTLIITCDCGISAVEPVAFANSVGVDVIITDHHQPPNPLPAACTIINPKQIGCPFLFKDLAGVGVAFYLLLAIRAALREKGYYEFYQIEEPNLKKFLDIVAIGTIADIVPLRDVNRILVKNGLEELDKSVRPGIIALKEFANCKDKPVTCSAVGYNMAPRLNAAGRIGEAVRGVELLTAPDYSKAYEIAQFLDQQNRKRQEIEAGIFQEAMAQVEQSELLQNRKSLVLSSDTWHPGVIGIVASRMVERFHKPTILISFAGGDGKGSGRSIERLNLYQAVRSCSHMLLSFGGHEYAVGLSMARAQLDEFSEMFEAAVRDSMLNRDFAPKLDIDTEITGRDITHELIEELKKLEPYGHSNQEPLFCCYGALVQQKDRVGKGHLKLRIQLDGKVFDAIGYNMADAYYSQLSRGQMVDLVFFPQINDYFGDGRLQLKLKDVRF